MQNTQQHPVNYKQTNGNHWPNNQLQQFLLANQLSSMQEDKNNLASMQALYESQMKWACLNNFYNHRIQQMFYAAYIIAQNSFKNRGFLPHQHNFTNSFMPQQNWNGINYNQGMFFNQPNIKQKHNKYYNPQNKKYNKSTDIEKASNKTNNSKKCKKTIQPNEFKTKSSDFQSASSKYNYNQSKHMQALTSGFTTKNETDSLKIKTSNHLETLQNFTKSSGVIAKTLPEVTETYKSTICSNLSPKRGISTNHQIIVTETEAEMIVNRVKEEMRGRDPENMYIKCPLCEKRIKRLVKLVLVTILVSN